MYMCVLVLGGEVYEFFGFVFISISLTLCNSLRVATQPQFQSVENLSCSIGLYLNKRQTEEQL